jgi:hypothetical protein
MAKESNVPDDAIVWGELWVDVEGQVNFKFHTERNFIRSKKALQRFARVIQERIDRAKDCPFFEE